MLDSYVSWAVQTSSVCDMRFKDHCRTAAGRQRLLPFQALVKAFVLGRDLRNRQALKRVLQRGISFALEPSLARMVLEHGDSDLVPSAYTLSRANLQVDIAYTLVLRKELQARKAKALKAWMFLKVDSSPQGGKDWLLAETVTLTTEDVAKLMVAFNTLADFEQGTSEHADASQEVFRIFLSHVLPPTALGSKHSNVIQKSSLHSYK